MDEYLKSYGIAVAFPGSSAGYAAVVVGEDVVEDSPCRVDHEGGRRNCLIRTVSCQGTIEMARVMSSSSGRPKITISA